MFGLRFFCHGRGSVMLTIFALLLTMLFCRGAALADAEVVRIGYQRSSTLMALLKADGTLERALAACGVTLRWHEFSSGLPMRRAFPHTNAIM